MDGRAPAPSRLRETYLAGIFHGPVRRQRTHGLHNASETRLAPFQRCTAKRSNDAGGTFCPARRPHYVHDGTDGPGQSHGTLRPEHESVSQRAPAGGVAVGVRTWMTGWRVAS